MPKTQKTSHLKYNLIPKGRILYFDEENHKYTDDIKTAYTSTTTIIGKYYEKFDSSKEKIALACERIGKSPDHPKYLRYKNKTAKQLIEEWAQETIRACEKGTAKHNYLEDAVKSSNGYHRTATGFINDRIYTIDDIIKGHTFGRLSINYFIKTGIDIKYPTIFGLIKELCSQGFKIYAEIGVYDTRFAVSGLVDILLVRGNEFYILDWKTNKAPIRFDSGYYDKNDDGTLNLNRFVYQDKYFFHPLSHLPDSIGNHYTLQLSVYDYLVESFGLKCLGNILCHIRTIDTSNTVAQEEKEEVNFMSIKYLKKEVEDMLMHHNMNNIKTTLF